MKKNTIAPDPINESSYPTSSHKAAAAAAAAATTAAARPFLLSLLPSGDGRCCRRRHRSFLPLGSSSATFIVHHATRHLFSFPPPGSIVGPEWFLRSKGGGGERGGRGLVRESASMESSKKSTVVV